jgi:hypothetical protein
MIEAISPQPKVQGENPVEMIDAMNSDLLMEEMSRVKENLKKLDAQDGRAEAILRALNKLEEELGNEAPRKGSLKRKGKPKTAEIDTSNIISQERTESIPWRLTDSETAVAESLERRMVKRKRTSEKEESSAVKVIGIGDKVKILTKRFGSVYEKGRKKFTKGIVQGIVGKVYEVLWTGIRKR